MSSRFNWDSTNHTLLLFSPIKILNAFPTVLMKTGLYIYRVSKNRKTNRAFEHVPEKCFYLVIRKDNLRNVVNLTRVGDDFIVAKT